nr:MAG TPA: hypothetical protein [Caudoviricetes sp.]
MTGSLVTFANARSLVQVYNNAVATVEQHFFALVTNPSTKLADFDNALAVLERAHNWAETARREFVNRNNLNKPKPSQKRAY